jgi:methylthioribose-1-phosphate isomerase
MLTTEFGGSHRISGLAPSALPPHQEKNRRDSVKVNGRSYRTIWLNDDDWGVDVIDQRGLPHEFRAATLRSVGEAATAIRDMWVRGAPLIGVTAAYGVALAMREDPSDRSLDSAWDRLHATRPTAINLRWALDAAWNRLRPLEPAKRAAVAYAQAAEIANEDVATNRAIGRNGLDIIRGVAAGKRPGQPVNILTHCNAGWLATVDYGTATAPIYLALEEGLLVHVYVDETRPRNQGASLTAWELLNHGAPHTLVVDNAGGHLMQHGLVDMVIVGTDRTTANGDVCNKVGTYLKALAAYDNDVPFYVALPSPTIDWTVRDGVKEIPIEERSEDEVDFVQGLSDDGAVTRVRISPIGSPAANPAFDVTPARLVTALITERGIAKASPEGLKGLFPERV